MVLFFLRKIGDTSDLLNPLFLDLSFFSLNDKHSDLF